MSHLKNVGDNGIPDNMLTRSTWIIKTTFTAASTSGRVNSINMTIDKTATFIATM